MDVPVVISCELSNIPSRSSEPYEGPWDKLGFVFYFVAPSPAKITEAVFTYIVLG